MRRREFLEASSGALAAAVVASNRSVFASAAGPDSTRRILYILGQFADATPESMRTVVETVGQSGFNVLVLSFLQAGFARNKLTLSYNGNEFSSLSPQVPALLRQLRSGFNERKKIMLSIGGWQHLPTFQAIRSMGVPAFVRQLTTEVIAPLGLDGIDLDLEPQAGGLDHWMAVHDEYGKILADVTNEYKRMHPTHFVTHAPLSSIAAELYVKPAPIAGLNGGLLAATKTKYGNTIDWLNVQFYEGGLVEGVGIAEYYRNSLAAPLLGLGKQAGILSPLHFLVPLFQPEAKQPLTFCQQTIAAIDARCADLHAGKLNGVALWDYRQVAPSIGDWSTGLKGSLQS